MHKFACQYHTLCYYLMAKGTILKLEYCIVVCFLEFIIISNSNRTMKICKNDAVFYEIIRRILPYSRNLLYFCSSNDI